MVNIFPNIDKIETNKIIATFMELLIVDGFYCINEDDKALVLQNYHEYSTKSYYDEENNISYYCLRADQLKYDISWEWLMPVIMKIGTLRYPVSLYFSNVQQSITIHELDSNSDVIRNSSTLKTPLELAYISVVDFIKGFMKKD